MKKKMILLSLSAILLSGCKGNPTLPSGDISDGFAKLGIVTDKSLKKERNPDRPKKYRESARQSLEDVSALWKENKANHVFSPASYLIAVSSLLAVSSSVDAYEDALKIENPKQERLDLLSSLNGEESTDYIFGGPATRIKSAAFYQQIGTKYAFDREKREKLAGEYVDSGVTDLSGYREQAQEYFGKKIGLERKIPELNPSKESVIIYGGLKRNDYASLGKRKKDFTGIDGKKKQVDAVPVGNKLGSKSYPYRKGKNFQRMSFPIRKTDLVVILPDEGTDITDIDLSKAYQDFLSSSKSTPLYGYIPFFSLDDTLNLTEIFDKVSSDKAKFCTELLKDDVINDLLIRQVIQASTFSFSDKGVKGESRTRRQLAGAAAPKEQPYTLFEVDRPFYAFSTYSTFPLFVNCLVVL